MKRIVFGALLIASVIWPTYFIVGVDDPVWALFVYSLVFCGAVGMGALFKLRPVSEKTKAAQIEKMAKAIYELDPAQGYSAPIPWERAISFDQSSAREAAEAAWEAMR